MLGLPKQFHGKGYAGWLAIAFTAVVKAGIWNLASVPAIARRLFGLREGHRVIFKGAPTNVGRQGTQF